MTHIPNEINEALLLESKADEMDRHNLSGDRHIASAAKDLRARAAALRAPPIKAVGEGG